MSKATGNPQKTSGWRWKGWRSLTFSGVLFGVLAIYKTFQHLTFNTYAYDLGIRASVLYNIAFQGKVWDGLHGLHGFSGHFHPISFILAGFYRLWPNALSLCLMQALAVSLGFLVFLRLLDRFVADRRKHIFLIAIFLVNPFLHHVLAFDFHPEIFALPLALLFFHLFENKHHWLAAIPAFALLTLKEDMGLLLLSLGVYAICRRKWLMGIVMAIVGAVWMPIMLTMVIPLFRASAQPELIAAHYPGLGQSASEIIMNLLRKPWLLLTQTLGQPQKLLSLALLAASFGCLALTRWEALLILPLLAAHLLSSGPRQSSLILQYSAGLLPVLFFASVRATSRIKFPVLAFLCILIIPSVLLRFPNPFKQGFDLKRSTITHQVISKIPEYASLSVSNNLAPHVLNRQQVTLYPSVNQASYILVDLESSIYPASWKNRYQRFWKISAGFDTLFIKNGLILVSRNNLDNR